MNGNDLLLELATGRIEKRLNVTIGEAILTHNLVDEALTLSLNPDRKISFRIAWGLEYAYSKNRNRFTGLHTQLISNYLSSHNESLYRIYGKITNDLLKRRSPEALNNMEAIAGKAFDLLVSEEVMVASKVWAMEILYQCTSRLDWVAENLAPTIEHQACLAPSPAMLNHSNKVLKRLSAKHKRKAK